MSGGVKSCEELCNRSICSYNGDTHTECFSKLPEVRPTTHARAISQEHLPLRDQRSKSHLMQVQKRLDKLIASSPAKLLPGESSTPFSKDYVWAKTKLLGKGAFGSVYRCRKAEEERYKYAVKELLLNDAPGGINSLKEVLHEVEVLQALSRFNACHVVKLHAFYRSKDTAWLVLELLPGQSLEKIIPVLHKLPDDDRQAIMIRTATELLELLAASHAMGVAHGDLKPANIFLDLQSCQKMAHVLDWGLATQNHPGEEQVLLQGTLEYLAPEVIDQWITKDKSMDPLPCDPAAADMWSLGVVLLEMYTGKNPFKVGWWRLATMQQAHGIRMAHKQWAGRHSGHTKLEKLVSALPQSAPGFFHGLLKEQPEDRLAAAEALQHPFLLAMQ